jgi:hypothetical protein
MQLEEKEKHAVKKHKRETQGHSNRDLNRLENLEGLSI